MNAWRNEPGDRTDSGQGRDDYHDPTAGIGGAPPARSALTLRLVLASWGLLLCVAAAVVLLTVVTAPVPAAVAAFLAAVALADLVVVGRRKRRGEPG
ncbi:MAG TPA: DUF6343 family protein [Streptosporangiaceae bacterium]|nr:DUF6343 family protein [Streptosporangiaceae bacterium]